MFDTTVSARKGCLQISNGFSSTARKYQDNSRICFQKHIMVSKEFKNHMGETLKLDIFKIWNNFFVVVQKNNKLSRAAADSPPSPIPNRSDSYSLIKQVTGIKAWETC